MSLLTKILELVNRFYFSYSFYKGTNHFSTLFYFLVTRFNLQHEAIKVNILIRPKSVNNLNNGNLLTRSLITTKEKTFFKLI